MSTSMDIIVEERGRSPFFILCETMRHVYICTQCLKSRIGETTELELISFIDYPIISARVNNIVNNTHARYIVRVRRAASSASLRFCNRANTACHYYYSCMRMRLVR